MGRKNTAVAATFPIDEGDDLMLISDKGQIIRVPVAGVSIQRRSSSGVTIFRVDDDERVVSVERIEEDSENREE